METSTLFRKRIKSFFKKAIAIVVLVMQTSCGGTMWFSYVDVKGRILDASNGRPLMCTVVIKVDDPYSSKESQMGSKGFASAETNSNGEFRVRAKAARRTGGYYFFVRVKDSTGLEKLLPLGESNRGGGTLISLPLDKQVDLGDVLVRIW